MSELNEKDVEQVTGGYRILANTDCEHHWYCPRYDITHDVDTSCPMEWNIEDIDVGRIIYPTLD